MPSCYRTSVHLRSLWFAAVVMLLAASPGFPANAIPENGPPQVLSSITDIRSLPPEIAGLTLPVRLRATVSFYNRQLRSDLTIEQAGVGIWVNPFPGFPKSLQAGDEIEIEGVTQRGAFASTIWPSRIRQVGSVTLPPAPLLTLDQLHTQQMDSQRVEVIAVVRAATIQRERIPPRLALEVVAGGRRSRAYISAFADGDLERLVGAKVRIRGVCFVIFDGKGQALSYQIEVATAADVLVEESSLSKDALPIEPAAELLRFRPLSGTPERARVRGVVTCCRPRKALYIRDSSGGLRISAADIPLLEPGTMIEAIGFPEVDDGAIVLGDASIMVVGQAPAPEASRVTVEQALFKGFDRDLITIEGKLESVLVTDEGQTFNLRAGGTQIRAELPSFGKRAPGAEVGSTVALTGLCEVDYVQDGQFTRDRLPQTFSLLLRSPADIQLLVAPPWWTRVRYLRVAGGLFVALLGVAAWALWLRRRNTFLWEQIAARETAETLLLELNATLEHRVRELTAGIEAKARFTAILEERTRMARELHDSVKQELVAIACHLDVALKNVAHSPEVARRHLLSADKLSRQSWTDVERSIRDLRSQALEEKDLASVLADLGEQLSSAFGIEILVQIDGPPAVLPPATEDHLLRIAHEAIANALKHAAPQRIVVALTYEERAISLSISDDGAGLQLVGAASRLGHFGLRGMRERALRIGAELDLKSVPGEGTVVAVRLPLQTVALAMADA